ncbi:hypothetical protein G2W53_029508 [Senna tora]|uniref:Uncharacterized protein n=1 Tax=Senna tora TaxID=362788 RepID=A0A834WFT7_9FABA|nr:hypothetical protein G2W53_029508 [Senna tora]
MWRLLADVSRNLQNMKKSSRVADENMFTGGNARDHREGGRRRHHQGFSIIVHTILQAPISILSCVSLSDNYGSDGFWASGGGDYSTLHLSDMNHMIVSDSMRFAILM